MTTNKENGKENPRQKTGKKKKTFQHILYSEPQFESTLHVVEDSSEITSALQKTLGKMFVTRKEVKASFRYQDIPKDMSKEERKSYILRRCRESEEALKLERGDIACHQDKVLFGHRQIIKALKKGRSIRVCLVDSCAPGNLLQSLMPLLRDRQVSTLGLPRLVEITKQTVGFKATVMALLGSDASCLQSIFCTVSDALGEREALMPSENVLHGTKLNEEDLSSDTTSSFENGKAMKKLKLEDNIIAKARGEGRKDGASDNLAMDATHTIVNSLV